MKEKILLFDLDGTLIDSTQAILESFVNTALFFGINLKERRGEIMGLIGATLRDMFMHFGFSEEETEQCIKMYRTNYERIYLEKTHLLPKVKEALESVPKSYGMGVVTSKNRYFSLKILEHLGINSFFSVVVAIDDVSEPKPSAEPIQRALEDLNFQAQEVYMIGDTFFDMQSAKNAGVIGIGVMGRYEKQLEKYTDFVFSDLFKAVNYIKEQN
ncbi:hypothetical protein BBW65_00530 [Helicobacter enhydrae]|uniref:phosphoglycolate phosphatase n=1 Tax=Helicobacter enhydrae TaxID=222136 RepID=A0A1B1U3M7_9HELI|nr:HAD family hydrolase [Helicobacter enhydrae]ANV97394.1 hypothetical protein BBW65_00530 [Helicobacter enhydrae]